MQPKRFSRREFLSWVGAAGSAALLAACGPTPTPEVVEKVVTKEVEKVVKETVEVEKVVTAVPEPSQRITVDFMNWWGAERQTLMEESIAAFEAEHPNIHVVNSIQPWDQRSERAATAVASRNPPAVIMAVRAETYEFAQEGLIIPIDDYVKASGLDLNAMFYPADLDNVRWGGKLWSLPLPGDGASSSLYFYSKNLLRKAGFDPEKPPATWQEMEKVAKAVTVMEGGGIKIFGADFSSEFETWLYCNNGKYVTDDAKKLTFNSPEGIETLEWMVKSTNEINGSIENVRDFMAGASDSSADLPFYNDRQAVLFAGTWQFGHLKSWKPEMWNDTNRWGVALRPYNGNNPQATHHGTSGLVWGWGYDIPKSMPKEVQDAAYQWVEWWITRSNPKEPGGCKFLFEQGQVSALKQCTQDSAWYETTPYWDVVVKALGTDVNVPITPIQSQITSFLNQAVEEALYGKKKPKEALDWAAEKGQEVLDGFWSKV